MRRARSICCLLLTAVLVTCCSRTGQAQSVEEQLQRLALERAYRHPTASLLTGRLQRAMELLNRQQTADGLDRLQELLDLPFDTTIVLPGSEQPTSLKRQIRRLIETLPQGSRRQYERKFEAEANILWERYRATEDLATLIDLVRRYFATPSGLRATEHLGGLLFDRGETDLAARVWLRAVLDAPHRQRLSAPSRAQIVLALRLSGLSSVASSLATSLEPQSLQLGGQSVPFEQWTSQHEDLALPAATHRHLSLGDRTQNASSPASPPHLDPMWVLPTVRDSDTQTRRLLEEWLQQQIETEFPVAVASFGIEHGNQLVARTSNHLVGLDLQSGQQRWHYQLNSSLSRAMDEVRLETGSNTRAEQTGKAFVDFNQAMAWNSVVGMPASDGQRVYIVDFVDLRSHRIGSRRMLGESGQATTRLVALKPPTEEPPVDGPAIDAKSGEGASGMALQPAWIVGGPIGVPVWFEMADLDRNEALDTEELKRTEGRFDQLDADRDGTLTRTEAAASGSPPSPLAGHFILGPPLPVDRMLYVVSELNQQLCLSALEAETGRVLWTQGIGFVRRDITFDTMRSLLACTPSYADGLVLCLTREDLIVAVDAITGELVWSQPFSDDIGFGSVPGRDVAFGGRRLPRLPYGHPGYVDLLVVDQGTAVFMPQYSKYIYAFDVTTGRLKWRSERDSLHQTGYANNGDEYVAAIHDGIVLIVGNRFFRGLSLSDGSEVWSQILGRPSGRGFRSVGDYFAPMDDGRVIRIRIQDGATVGHGMSHRMVRNLAHGPTVTDWTLSRASAASEPSQISLPDRWRPGNLLAMGDSIVSVSADAIAVFPQAEQLLRSRELAQDAPPADRLRTVLLTAQLQLTLGNLEQARRQLQEVLHSVDKTSAPEQYRQLAAMYRSVLYLDLDSGESDSASTLSELEQLAETADQQVAFLLRRGEDAVRRESSRDLMDTIGRLLPLRDLPPQTLHESSLRQSIFSHMHGLLDSASRGWAPEHRQQLAVDIESLWKRLATTDELAEVEMIAQLLGRFPGGEQARSALWKLHHRRGQWQSLELTLLSDIESGRPVTEAQAAARLMELWDRLGLHDEALTVSRRLQTDYAKVPLSTEQTGLEFVTSYVPSDELAAVRAAQQPTGWPVRTVTARILRAHQLDPHVSQAIVGHRSANYPLPHGYSQRILDKGSDQQPQLVVLDRRSATELARISVPREFVTPLASRQALAGHLVTAVSRKEDHIELLGLSLLPGNAAGQIQWTQKIADDNAYVRAGPAGPDFAVFQIDDRLLVLDPQNGRVLWDRRQLSSNGGFVSDPETGLVGDGQVLTFFESDRTSYMCFDTLTGRVLGKGSLPFGRRVRLGRKLLYDGYRGSERRFFVWDPASNSIDIDQPVFEPVQGRVFSPVVENTRHLIALLSSADELTLWNTQTSAPEISLPLAGIDWTQVIGLDVDRRADVYLVSFRLQRLDTHLRPREPGSEVLEPLPGGLYDTIPVNGDLLAFSADDGRLLWRREVVGSSLLQTEDEGLPFLLSIAQVRQGRRTMSLKIDVIDIETGLDLCSDIRLPPDRIIHVANDPQVGRMTLQGVNSGVELNYARWLQRVFEDQPAFDVRPAD